MALRWTAAAMLEAAWAFRGLKAHRQLPVLKAALADQGRTAHGQARSCTAECCGKTSQPRSDGPANFNKDRCIPIRRRSPWGGRGTVKFAVLTWVDWFNHRRLLAPIGNIPPAEAEERYYAMLQVQKLAT